MPDPINLPPIPPPGLKNVEGPPLANNPTNSNSTVATVAGVTGTAFATGLTVTGLAQASGVGVLGNGATGVQGMSENGVGVQGSTGSGTGVSGTSSGGVGVYGAGGQYAGKFDGAILVNGDATVTGTLTANVDIVLSAAHADCAEEFDIGSVAEAEPGTVMVLDDSGALERSSKSYDKRVAGVISGAGPYRPGIVLGRGEGSPTRLPVALIGKVVCKVDAQYGPIEVGDLLTTSPTPGHAMSATDRTRAFGAVIGKALQRFSEGCGSVPILVALQ